MAENKLSRIMKEKGMTIKTLGELSGVSWRTIEGLYQGRYSLANAKAAHVIAITKALNVNPADLLAE